jgi:hypothetical protein
MHQIGENIRKNGLPTYFRCRTYSFMHLQPKYKRVGGVYMVNPRDWAQMQAMDEISIPEISE